MQTLQAFLIQKKNKKQTPAQGPEDGCKSVWIDTLVNDVVVQIIVARN